jgi:hypothetical protein
VVDILCRERRSGATWGDDHVHLAANQIGGQRWQSIVSILGPAVFDRDILALQIAGLFQPLPDGLYAESVSLRRSGKEQADHRHRRLLRARRERPRRRAAEEGDERAPFHVWMAPAWQEKM